MIPISVIVPVYNAERTLRECVDSILSQEFKDFELLLVNDGSKDGSGAICDDYAREDNRVKVFHKENGGVSSARNLGLDNAIGDWVAFVDSDDFVSQGYLNEVVNQNCNLVMKGYKDYFKGSFVSDKMMWKESFSSDVPTFLNSYLGTAIMRGPVCKFFRRSKIGCLRFNEKLKVGEDSLFVFEYFSKIDTMKIVADGYYVIRIPDEKSVKKYSMTVDYAAESLEYMKNGFERLSETHFLRKNYFFPYMNYFKLLSMEDWLNEPSKWYKNATIKGLYDFVWRDLSIKNKVRIMFARFFGR